MPRARHLKRNEMDVKSRDLANPNSTAVLARSIRTHAFEYGTSNPLEKMKSLRGQRVKVISVVWSAAADHPLIVDNILPSWRREPAWNSLWAERQYGYVIQCSWSEEVANTNKQCGCSWLRTYIRIPAFTQFLLQQLGLRNLSRTVARFIIFNMYF